MRTDHIPSLLDQLERTNQEIASCERYISDKSHPERDRAAATMGWADWSVNREMILEELAHIQGMR